MDIEVGSEVIVYDRNRFGTPLKAIVNDFAHTTDGVRVTLLESNNKNEYPIGYDAVWVHLAQLRLVKQNDPGPGGIGID